ncbi:hypothetical protein, variant [Aphanomyces invadans]|uniref:RING-type domain-containing protein n=1 Tax=Aphanomyces invadans TaxID=157072 RepID=A0A024UQV1_9STRA|nr:hypothetical protein, variant [Aphanomyces invadans]ETW08232.1 hypothetical protein, variant [Aphanomyces invadans]|eukprot:XP_008862037.1 hypothetical protein, variant [Aphanomyces invadans]
MKWVQEQLSQCVAGQNGNSKWDKRAASYWSEDTETAKALAEELGHSDDDTNDFVRCVKKNLAVELTPKIALPNVMKHTTSTARDRTVPVEPTVTMDEIVSDDSKIQPLAPGLISVASCDTDLQESLALKLMRFDPSKATSPVLQPHSSTNLRFLSLLRNVRRLESQYAEHGRMLASTIVELPSFTYTSPVDASADHGTKRCAICLSDFSDAQEIRVLPCFHTYHSWCIDKWLLNHAKCPVCILSP